MPKKRGPKTDVLEALLKRVDGLEKRLVSEGKNDDLADSDPAAPQNTNTSDVKPIDIASSNSRSPQQGISPSYSSSIHHATQLMSPVESRYAEPPPNASTLCTRSFPRLTSTSPQHATLAPELLLDTYFARIHGKPYYILDETTTRQRLQANQLPSHLAYAIYAVSARYGIPIPAHNAQDLSDLVRFAPHFGGYSSAVRIGQEYARRARLELDIDEPSIETLQTLMLLSQANFQLGKGKKTFMLLSMTPMTGSLDSVVTNSVL